MPLFPPDTSHGAADWIHAHCDGGSRGNPGPAGYGALVTDAHGQTLAELSDFLGIRTNNFAEYSGLLAVLAYALENKHPRLKVVSDSELMVKQIQGKYKVNSPDLKPLWQEARNRIAKLDAFEISHALRHKNKEADALANQAMDRGMKRPGSGHAGSGASTAVQSLPLRPIPSAATPYPAKSTAPPDPYAANRTGTSSTYGPGAPSMAASSPRVGSTESRTREPAITSAPKAPDSRKPELAPGAMHRGFTRDGVIHLLGGATLPDGVFVKIIRE